MAQCPGLAGLLCYVLVLSQNVYCQDQDSSGQALTTKTVTNGSTINALSDKELEAELECKRSFIREMARESYAAYERIGWVHHRITWPEEISEWPQEAIRPVGNTTFNRPWMGERSGLTLVNSMSTLWVLGLREEFNRAKEWALSDGLRLVNLPDGVQVLDLTNCYVGGLLSVHALSQANDTKFVDKAVKIAQIVEPALRTYKGL